VSGQAPDRIDHGVVVALAAMAAAVFVVANDVTALSVALPSIEKEFNADVNTVQWVINAYALVFGVLIVTGGRLADLFGRRRIFFTGCAIFVAFSLLGALAQSAIWLIACRALMGIGGAMMWPAVLGMTYAALPESKAGIAGGLIIGAAGFGNAAGPLIGGAITDSFGWQWVLVLNLPVAAVACAATWYAIHQPGVEEGDRRLDYAGIVSLTVGLVALLFALDQVTDWGIDDPRVVGLFVGFVALIVMFAAIERRGRPGALIPRDVIGNRDFRFVCLAVLLMSPTFFAALLYLPQFMQKILDYSPLEAGAGLLPMMGTFAAVSFAAGPLYQRLGPKTVVCAGAACLAVGPFLISMIDSGSGYAALLPGMVVLGLGVGLFYSSITTAGVTALDPSRASLAGGIVYMFQVAGGSVGLGLTTMIFTTAAHDNLQQQTAVRGDLDAVQGVLAGTDSAQRIVSQLPPASADRVVGLVRDSFAAGMQWSFRVVALLAVGGFLVSLLFVGGSLLRARRPATAEG
jgi:EmrB/QacA subfamily drug resistance transporter